MISKILKLDGVTLFLFLAFVTTLLPGDHQTILKLTRACICFGFFANGFPQAKTPKYAVTFFSICKVLIIFQVVISLTSLGAEWTLALERNHSQTQEIEK